MYSASVFGVTFPDVIGQELGMHYDRKVALWQMKRQKEMAEWQAKNLPLFQRQGLEAAGINPLLAYSGGVGSQTLPSALAMSNHSGQLGGFDASAFQASKKLWTDANDDEDEQRDANIKLTNKEIEKKDAEIEAIKNQSNINSDVNERNSILDWIRGILPSIGSAFGAYWLGRKGSFSSRGKTPVKTPVITPVKTPVKTPGKMPGKTPGEMPGKMPGKTPGEMPGKMSGFLGTSMFLAPYLDELNSAYGTKYLWNPLKGRLKDLYNWRMDKAKNQSLKRPRHKGNFKR